MSSCPTNDIHSVYLDGELPLAYITEYESHLKTCEKCANMLSNMRAISAVFKADAGIVAKDDVFMAQSYERLMHRMSYSRITKKAARMRFKPVYFVPMAAAAALLVAVVVPIKLIGAKKTMHGTQPQMAHVSPITRSQNISMEQKNLVINGTITPNAINSNIPLNVSTAPNFVTAQNFATRDASSLFIAPQPVQAENKNSVFTEFDMFAPQINPKQQLVLKVMPQISEAGQQIWTFTFTTDENIQQ